EGGVLNHHAVDVADSIGRRTVIRDVEISLSLASHGCGHKTVRLIPDSKGTAVHKVTCDCYDIGRAARYAHVSCRACQVHVAALNDHPGALREVSDGVV